MSRKIILSGCMGRMGKTISGLVENSADFSVVAGVDIVGDDNIAFPIYNNISQIKEKADVIIDFSNSSSLDSLLDYAKETATPLVLATTGYSDEQIEKIKKTAKFIPIFFSFNMSLGVNLILSLSKKAATILGDGYDIEIIEKHHNQKLDAPSGTAIMIANAIDSAKNGEMQFEYDRHSKRQKRQKNEIGIHSVRGGTIVGEHEVIFAGDDEIISISHTASSRRIFAVGALRAADFISKIKAVGLYDMDALIASL